MKRKRAPNNPQLRRLRYNLRPCESQALNILPAELCFKIFSYHTNDWHYGLWNNVRKTCKTFHDITEHMFEKHILPTMAIEFRLFFCYNSVYDLLNPTCRCDIKLSFDRVSADNSMAVFSCPSSSGEDPKDRNNFYQKYLMSLWENQMRNKFPRNRSCKRPQYRRSNSPPWAVHIQDNTTLSHFPKWKIGYDKRELSCCWKGMMTCHCLEMGSRRRDLTS
jgi:hypothetical protein